jgi:serine/threonine protein kinase/tetratricopeptide (TPR) repeat protein
MSDANPSDKGLIPASSESEGRVSGQAVPDADVTLESTSAEGSTAEGSSAAEKSIGPYRLVRKHGEGGMGEVWLAEQSAPVKRLVALKVIRAGRADESALQRFNLERQSLAIMDHPSIAKVFDAGSTSAGQPYFVMEYVPGLPITSYCASKKLRTRERLELLVRVCEGVQHAHQRAILHRDLKPSNILVVDVDGIPTPRIIDFGIAKALSGRPEEEPQVTQFGRMIGTPGYMSPEQSDPRAVDVDTRTDVYSLGVVMYELLTGVLPFDPQDGQKKPLDEMLRQLREDDPPRPSTRVELEGKKSTAGGKRKPEFKQLARLLSGDIDLVTMKALEKDRARRYDSCSALAMDIRRFLNQEPVLAAPPSFVYRAGKFIRRNRVAVSAASAVALTLVTLAVSMTVQAIRIARERDRANREASAAKSVSGFLIGLFKVSDPSEARGNTITARQILDQGVKQIDAGLAGQPEVHARLMGTMGEVYRSLGLYKEAAPLLEKAMDTRLRVLGPENPDTLSSMYQVARNLNEEGQYAEAEELLRKVVEAQRRVLGPGHPDTIVSMMFMAGVVYEEGHDREAEKLERDLLDLQRHSVPMDERQIQTTMDNLAVNLTSQGRLAEAETIYRESLEGERRTFGPDHPVTLGTMQNLARALTAEHKYGEAKKLLREALEIQNRILGPEHGDTLWTRQAIANALRDEGNPRDAEKLTRETLAARVRTLGPEHADTVQSIEELAVTLDELRRYPEAERLYLKVVESQSRVLGPNHPTTAASKYNLACNAALQGKRDEAIAILRDSIAHGLAPALFGEIAEDEDLKSLHGDPRFEELVAKSKNQSAGSQP